MSHIRRRAIVIAATGIVVGLSWFMGPGTNVEGAAKDKPHESRKDKIDKAIEETKTKGFDGVDFSYDVFGAPPGQEDEATCRVVTRRGPSA